jgi:pimeloyl-ACP methyl ester carboxylesterase
MNQSIGKTLRVNGADLYVETRGTGEPLLLLHGLTGSGQDWAHAGGDVLAEHFELIVVDARGHGRSTNPARTFTHRQCALDVVALLDLMGVQSCKAIGMSFGGNILLHVATQQFERIEAMVLVSSTPYFPDQARRLMAALPVEATRADEWDGLRKRHHLGDEQIRALLEQQYALKDSYDDMNLTPPELSRVRARTLIVQGDRDPLYPLELSLEMYRAIPKAELCVVPNAGHGPIFLEHAKAFTRMTVDFLGRT